MNRDLLREAVHDAVANEPPLGDPFLRFEAVRARATRLRALAVAVVTFGVFASFAWVFPSPFESGAPADFHGGGPLDPQGRFVNRYVDARARFQLSYPLEWSGAGTDGAPARFSPVAADGRRAYERVLCDACDAPVRIDRPRALYVRADPTRCAPDACGRLLRRGAVHADLRQRDVTVMRLEPVRLGRVEATTFSLVFPDRADAAFASWCTACHVTEYVTRWRARWVVSIQVIAPDGTSFEQDRRDAERLVQSLRSPVDQAMQQL